MRVRRAGSVSGGGEGAYPHPPHGRDMEAPDQATAELSAVPSLGGIQSKRWHEEGLTGQVHKVCPDFWDVPQRARSQTGKT